MPVPAIGMKKRPLKAILPHNITSVRCITKDIMCRKTMLAPATGLKKLLCKEWLLRNTILASFTTVGRE